MHITQQRNDTHDYPPTHNNQPQLPRRAPKRSKPLEQLNPQNPLRYNPKPQYG